MKFIDALKNVIKTKSNEAYFDLSELSNVCGVDEECLNK